MATTGNKKGSSGMGTTNWDTTAAPTPGAHTAATDNESLGQTLRDTTFRQLDDRKARASDTLGSIAGAVRGMSQPLRDGGQGGIANYVNKAADGIERWAGDLKQQDIHDALRAAQRFARRQPALFLGAAFTAGLLAARFLKSSGSDGRADMRYDTSRGPRPMGTNDYAANPAANPYGTRSGDIPRLSTDPRPTGEVI
jgi:hypothetical protein